MSVEYKDAPLGTDVYTGIYTSTGINTGTFTAAQGMTLNVLGIATAGTTTFNGVLGAPGSAVGPTTNGDRASITVSVLSARGASLASTTYTGLTYIGSTTESGNTVYLIEATSGGGASTGSPVYLAIPATDTTDLIEITLGSTTTYAVNTNPSDAACYVTGARILTPLGEMMVEGLKVGDLAVAAAGEARTIVQIGQPAVS